MLPVLVYQVYWGNTKTTLERAKVHQLLIGLVASLSIVLSMTYPFYTTQGYIFDLRLVPLAISILYGEYAAGIFSLIVLVIYRTYYVGGPGVSFAIIVEPLLSSLFFVFVNRYKEYGGKKRIFIGTSLLLSVFILKNIASYLFIPNYAEKADFSILLTFLFAHAIVIFSNLYLIERSRLQILLEQRINTSEKNEVVSHLAASIAHEIRNPLTVVRGFLQFMEFPMDKDKYNTYRKLMLEELGRAETIINDYLTFAKPEAGSPEKVTVREILQIALNIVNSYALSNKIVLDLKIEINPSITIEKTRLVQVLVNIIKNAVEAMPHGGTISIVSNQVQNSKAMIKIIDQGNGMTPEQILRLGQPYYSTKEKGTGLGLMVSYKIIHAMNGEIKVKSEIGKGTEFMIMIPLTV